MRPLQLIHVAIMLPLLWSWTCYAQSRVKVMTYNIHHANPPSKPNVIDIDAIANVINQSGAEVVALQELDINNERSGTTLDQAKEIARKTDMDYFFAKGIDFQGGQYGVAILSKYPIVKRKRYALPMVKGSGGEPRALAVATLQLAQGKKITFACTHLDLIEENRLQQAAFIIDKLGKINKNPVFLAGDLNAEPGSKVMNLFLDHFSRSVPDGPTYPETEPTQRLDYILYASKNTMTIENARIINETYASDHLPIYAEFIF